jgi:uncharacterized protein YjbJ (UPF0337 family)
MTHTPAGTYVSGGADDGTSTGDVRAQAQGAAEQIAGQAQDAAAQVAGRARQQATSQLEVQKERAVDGLQTIAQALRSTGEQLDQQEQASIGRYAEQAADRVEDLTNFLRTRDVPQLLDETQTFARRQPGLFLGGAIVLGFVFGRFLTSSGQRARKPVAQGYSGGSYGGFEERGPASYATGLTPRSMPGGAAALEPVRADGDSAAGVPAV